MRVALYARVSTTDKDQDPENQRQVLRREAERVGDVVYKEYVDEDSGRKSTGSGAASKSKLLDGDHLPGLAEASSNKHVPEGQCLSSWMIKRVPKLTSLMTSILPPMASTWVLTRNRPMPRPRWLVWKRL